MAHLVLDLETAIDERVWTPPPPREGEEPPFPPLHAHRVVSAGGLWLDEELNVNRLDILASGADERAILDVTTRELAARPTLVTVNGRGFDLPVLRLRCLRHGVIAPVIFDEGAPHVDLLSLAGARVRTGLDGAARICGLPGKALGDGASVDGWWRAGQQATIDRYCLADVAQTALVFLRWQLVRGALDGERYRNAAKSVMNVIAADARLEELTALLDDATRARVLDAT